MNEGLMESQTLEKDKKARRKFAEMERNCKVSYLLT